MKCLEKCNISDTPCKERQCRMWIDYPVEYNCCLESIKRNGDMTLRQIGERLKLSFVRVKQIQDKAIKKLQK